MTKNEDRINKLFKELVPETGKADSLAGELVRAMSRIAYRFYNDGDMVEDQIRMDKEAGREPLAYDPQFFYDTIVELMEQDEE